MASIYFTPAVLPRSAYCRRGHGFYKDFWQFFYLSFRLSDSQLWRMIIFFRDISYLPFFLQLDENFTPI